MKQLLYLIIYFISVGVYSQNKNLFNRLHAIKNKDIIFYNIDGIRISKQSFSYRFNKKGLKKVFRKYKIKKKEIKTKDSLIKYNHTLIKNNIKISPKLTQKSSIYFIENKHKKITVLFFDSYKRDTKLERELIPLIIENKIPKSTYTDLQTDFIDFAGRLIKLGGNCGWRDVNSVQCPGYGQMNWSIHNQLESAEETIQHQLNTTKFRKNTKVVSEEFVDIEFVDIEFENTPTKAKKVVYRFKSGASFFNAFSGAETLTVYYVACKIRNRYVSCVLSFWNNDPKGKSGLPPLLQEVMKVKNIKK